MIRVSNSLDPDQDRHNVGPDLDPNSLQRFQQMTKVTASKDTVIAVYTFCNNVLDFRKKCV